MKIEDLELIIGKSVDSVITEDWYNAENTRQWYKTRDIFLTCPIAGIVKPLSIRFFNVKTNSLRVMDFHWHYSYNMAQMSANEIRGVVEWALQNGIPIREFKI
jgi:hypothetical protein